MKNETSPVHVRVDVGTKQKLTALAAATERSLSEVVRGALNDYVDRALDPSALEDHAARLREQAERQVSELKKLVDREQVQ